MYLSILSCEISHNALSLPGIQTAFQFSLARSGASLFSLSFFLMVFQFSLARSGACFAWFATFMAYNLSILSCEIRSGGRGPFWAVWRAFNSLLRDQQTWPDNHPLENRYLSILSCEIRYREAETEVVAEWESFQFSLARSAGAWGRCPRAGWPNFQFSLARSEGHHSKKLSHRNEDFQFSLARSVQILRGGGYMSLSNFQFSLARSDTLRKCSRHWIHTFNSLLRDQLIVGLPCLTFSWEAFNSLLRDQYL